MKLLTKNRGEYMKEIITLDPYKIASFSEIRQPLLGSMNIKFLTTPDTAKKQIEFKNWEIRTNNKVHMKLVIGTLGFYIGSWNLSDNSTNYFHEAGIIIELKSEQSIQAHKKLEEYFDSIYERSTKKTVIQNERDTQTTKERQV